MMRRGLRECRGLRTSLPILAAALLPIACGDYEAQQDGIVGSWEVTEASGTFAGASRGVSYTFEPDGAVTVRGQAVCSYAYAGRVLDVICGPVRTDFRAELREEGKVLVLSDAGDRPVMRLRRE